ncbi:MAG: diphosphomevalonate decarboxylase, partial [Gammaproteobacteria bacterium]
PYYAAWLDTSARDLEQGRNAVLNRDFQALADVAQSSCLKMHSVAMTTRPTLLYWNGATVECVRALQGLQQEGVPVFFTIDAGPQVKAVCEPSARQQVFEVLQAVPGVKEVILSGLGAGAECS